MNDTLDSKIYHKTKVVTINSINSVVLSFPLALLSALLNAIDNCWEKKNHKL